VLNTLFKKRNKNLIGLDISSNSLKLVALKSTGNSHNSMNYCVDAATITPIPNGAVVEKEIKDSAAVSKSIKMALSQSGCQATDVAVALADSCVITKTISLPASIPESELEAQVMLEADKHIPYAIEEVRMDFEIIGPTKGNDKRIDVLLAASRAEIVNQYIQAVADAGLQIKVVDVESYAVQRAYNLQIMNSTTTSSSGGLANETAGETTGEATMSQKTQKQAIGIYDIGAKRSIFTVLYNGRPLFTRSDATGSSQLTQAIAEHYQMSFDEAEKAKLNNKLPEDFSALVLHFFH